MSALEMLAELARGAAIPRGTLLQNCRLSAFGADYYGEEDIAELFRGAPLGRDAPEMLRTPGHAALIWPDQALVADLSGDHIARLWRLGSGEPAEREPAVAVPFDPDMAQHPAAVLFDPGDHQDLAEPTTERVRLAGERLTSEWTLPSGEPPSRVRPIVIRAFSQGERTAVLFAVHVLGGAPQRRAGFVHAAAIVGGEDVHFVHDLAGARALMSTPWLPSFG